MAETKVPEMQVSQIGDPVPSKVGKYKNVQVFKDIQTVLVEFTDKEGVKQTKLAVVIGREIRFFSEDVLSGPAQPWLADNILVALGLGPVRT